MKYVGICSACHTEQSVKPEGELPQLCEHGLDQHGDMYMSPTLSDFYVTPHKNKRGADCWGVDHPPKTVHHIPE